MCAKTYNELYMNDGVLNNWIYLLTAQARLAEFYVSSIRLETPD